jgi:hypothetical protein
MTETRNQQTAIGTEVNKLEIGITNWKDIGRGMSFSGIGFDGAIDDGVVHKKYESDGYYYVEIVCYGKSDENEIMNHKYILTLERDGMVYSMERVSISFGRRGLATNFDDEETTIKMRGAG